MKIRVFDRPLYILPLNHRGSFQFGSMSSRRPVLYEKEGIHETYNHVQADYWMNGH